MATELPFHFSFLPKATVFGDTDAVSSCGARWTFGDGAWSRNGWVWEEL